MNALANLTVCLVGNLEVVFFALFVVVVACVDFVVAAFFEAEALEGEPVDVGWRVAASAGGKATSSVAITPIQFSDRTLAAKQVNLASLVSFRVTLFSTLSEHPAVSILLDQREPFQVRLLPL
jgi:hypothetical protein